MKAQHLDLIGFGVQVLAASDQGRLDHRSKNTRWLYARDDLPDWDLDHLVYCYWMDEEHPAEEDRCFVATMEMREDGKVMRPKLRTMRRSIHQKGLNKVAGELGDCTAVRARLGRAFRRSHPAILPPPPPYTQTNSARDSRRPRPLLPHPLASLRLRRAILDRQPCRSRTRAIRRRTIAPRARVLHHPPALCMASRVLLSSIEAFHATPHALCITRSRRTDA
ncbi:hypothetical protein MSAN_00176800 [Mycena sanguinolenta]|uniref:Uncharacterized protein n=1 Tax=Mycena sanguinolenta TaxID=230812 RepID=A0A8H7DKI4_9AGAR|nr:hypothetical protein MSAN_00176800 [Mycena sanguinolenta]